MRLTGRKSFFITLILVSIIYFQSNFYDLIFLDDDTLVFHQPVEASFGKNVTSILTTNFLDGHYYRPLTSFSFFVNSFFIDNSPSVYHITNFLLHFLTAFLIFLILQRLDYSTLIALISALVFAVNPIHINAVGWIAGRGDLLASFLSVSALYIFLHFIKNNRTELLIFVSLLIFLAFLSKEVSLIVPFLFLAFYFIEKKEILLNKSSISVLIMFFVIIGSYYLLRLAISPTVHINKFSFLTYYKNILVLPQTVSKFFFPAGIKALPGNDLLTSILGGLIFLVLVMLPFLLKKINRTRYYFGLVWFIVLLIPGMVFRTMMQDGFFYWDCRSYLPVIGFVFITAEIFKTIRFDKNKTISYGFVIVYILVLSTVTFTKIRLYENAASYWNAVKLDYPQKFLPYIGLYNYYDHIKDFSNAEDQLVQAIKLRPTEFSIRDLLIKFYQKNNQSDKAFVIMKDTIYKKINGSAALLEKFISLSSELNKQEEINELKIIYKDDAGIIEKINTIKSEQN